jgi:Mlc titration factor MtfA (ptsG expression regulator)
LPSHSPDSLFSFLSVFLLVYFVYFVVGVRWIFLVRVLKMLVTPATNRRNQITALTVAGLSALGLGILGWFNPILLPAVLLSAGVYWLVRRRVWRRLAVMKQPFPPAWEAILRAHVAYFNALDDAEKERFRKMVQVFLDEVRITGIRADVDDTCRVLVAASAIIPVFGFPDWEYTSLGEVLIYPGRFDEGYKTEGDGDRRTLGLTGVGNGMTGVMILSKPDLLLGFDNPRDKRNVGIHEFAHLVDKADGSVDSLPPGVPAQVAQPWIAFVMRELRKRPSGKSDIDPYAYTNEAEFFAVLSEYFFESPAALEERHPEIYRMMRAMYHQDTRSLLAHLMQTSPPRLARNAPCPCGSGKKYKHCCLAQTAKK